MYANLQQRQLHLTAPSGLAGQGCEQLLRTEMVMHVAVKPNPLIQGGVTPIDTAVTAVTSHGY